MCILSGGLAGIGSILGAAVSAAGMMMQAQQQAAQYKMQAEMAQRQQVREIEQGAYESEITQRKGEKVIGQARAGMVASGIDINSGSAMDAQVSSATELQMDMDAIRWTAGEKRNDQIYKEKEAKFNAGMAMKAGAMNAAASLVGGLSPLLSGGSSGSTGQKPGFALGGFFRR